MDVNASNGPVLIDYTDAIITTITLANIGITEATAIFPEQQLTETLKEHSFDLKGAQISEIGIKEGTVTVNVLSTLPNGKMVYNIPSLKKNGIPFSSGDLLVHVNVWTPKTLDKKQKQFFESMKENEHFEPKPENSDKSFFDRVKDMFS